MTHSREEQLQGLPNKWRNPDYPREAYPDRFQCADELEAILAQPEPSRTRCRECGQIGFHKMSCDSQTLAPAPREPSQLRELVLDAIDELVPEDTEATVSARQVSALYQKVGRIFESQPETLADEPSASPLKFTLDEIITALDYASEGRYNWNAPKPDLLGNHLNRVLAAKLQPAEVTTNPHPAAGEGETCPDCGDEIILGSRRWLHKSTGLAKCAAAKGEKG